MVHVRRDKELGLSNMLRQIIAQLEVVDTFKHHGRHLDNISDDEDDRAHVATTPQLVMNLGEERFLKALTSLKSTPQFNSPKYNES